MTDRRRVKRLVKIWATIGVIVLILGYSAFRARTFVTGPRVTVTSPLDGSLVSEPLVTVGGSVKNIAFLTLNGNKIFTNEAGIFSEEILLSNGYNRITLEAQDRFGRHVEKTLQVIYK